MQIRTATLADLDAIATIEAECFPAAEAASKESFAARLALFADHFWLVEEDGALLGFLNGAVIDDDVIDDACYEHADCHNPSGTYQTVFGINTLPSYRKRGVGGMMLRAMIETARNEGRKGCILTCKDVLKHYYESFGFVCKGRSASTHGGAVWNDMILLFCDEHHHEHAHHHDENGCSCGCGGHHHAHTHAEDSYAEETKEIISAPATPEQRDFLRNFAPIAPLPIAKYLIKSSKEHSFENVALRDVCLRSAEDNVETIKDTAAFLQALEASNLIAIDYDTPLSEESYAHYAQSDSFLLLQDTVAQGAAQHGFLGDIVALEKGCIVMTAWGKEQIEAF